MGMIERFTVAGCRVQAKGCKLQVESCSLQDRSRGHCDLDWCAGPVGPGRMRAVCRSFALALVATLFALAVTSYAQAQEPVPRNEDAELIFEQAIDAFEEGDFGMAYRRFRLVYRTYDVNRKTTAAMLMAGKSLYRSGEFQDAAALLDELVDRYPTSSYLDEARTVRQLAIRSLDESARQMGVREIGVILPLVDEHATLAQALFTGIRIAVEEHNRLNVEQPVRMVFRNSGADASEAADLVSELARSGVEAIIGPLYSSEALAAAREAERHRVVLIPPLANDKSVSEGRHYVFQANPTITMRGRLMGQFAMRGLRLNEFGIIAERDRDQISERMAEGFQEEVMLQGGTVHYYSLLESQRDWQQLSDIMGADTMSIANAVYMPISGGESIARIDAALTSLDRMGLAGRIRVLGNTEWHQLPSPAKASRYETTYTNDFYVDEDDASVQGFMQDFEEINGERPDPGQTIGRLAFSGYDVVRYLIPRLISESPEPLYERIRSAPEYQGLGLRIDFSDSNVNQALYYFRYRDGRVSLLR